MSLVFILSLCLCMHLHMAIQQFVRPCIFYAANNFVFRSPMRDFMSDSVTYRTFLIPESIIFVPVSGTWVRGQILFLVLLFIAFSHSSGMALAGERHSSRHLAVKIRSYQTGLIFSSLSPQSRGSKEKT